MGRPHSGPSWSCGRRSHARGSHYGRNRRRARLGGEFTWQGTSDFRSRPLSEIIAAGEIEAGESAVMIPLLLDAGRTVKANVTFDAGLLAAIDAEAEQRGLTRAAFLASAAREKIKRASNVPTATSAARSDRHQGCRAAELRAYFRHRARGRANFGVDAGRRAYDAVGSRQLLAQRLAGCPTV